MKAQLVVPTSMFSGMGESIFYTNIRQFNGDLSAANARIFPTLQTAPGPPSWKEHGAGLDEHRWLVEIISPHCTEMRASTIATVHLDRRGHPYSAAEAEFVKMGDDPNYSLRIRDSEEFLSKKLLKGLAARISGKDFFDAPRTGHVTVDESHPLYRDIEQVLAYQVESGRKHRALMAQRLSKSLSFQVSSTWRAHEATSNLG